MSNEAVVPQIDCCFSTKDHIRNRSGKKKPRKSSLETRVLKNVLPGTWKNMKTFFFFFFLNVAKEIDLQMVILLKN